MKTLVIPINWKCFSKCVFCQFKRFDWKNQIVFDELKKYKKLYIQWDYNNVMITDGEPLYHDLIIDIIEYILKFSSHLIIDTNWERFSDSDFLNKCNNLFKWKNITIKIPIYWSNTKRHNLITNWKFDLLLKWLINLRKYKWIKVKLHSLVLKQNYKDLSNLTKIANKLWYKIKFIYTIPDWYIEISKILVNFSEIYKYNNIEIENIPKCISNKINDKLWNDTKTTILDWKIKNFKDDFASNRLEKKFIKKCDTCSDKEKCSWIYVQYINIFWEEEFWK